MVICNQLIKKWLPVALVVASASVHAFSQAEVSQVQAPAWVQRGDLMMPLTPGMTLKHKDRITTGRGARAYLKLAEGSTVKLGANTQFVFYNASTRKQPVYRGALDVVQGAFRFTTDILQRKQARDLMVRVGTSTVGIRGTDVWGRASAAEDLAVLIEGKVEISRAGESVMLDTPLTRYRATPEEGILPLLQLDPNTLDVLARETEIMAGDGTLLRSGRWRVDLGSVDTQDEALSLYDQARAAGYAARINVRKAGSGLRYDVFIPNLATRAEAEALALRYQSGFRTAI